MANDYVIAGDVVRKEGQELSNIAASIQNLQKPTPPAEIKAPEITPEKKGEEGAPVETPAPQVQSQIETPEVKPEPTKGKGKKKDAKPDDALDVIAAKGKDGKDVNIQKFSDEDRNRLSEALGDDPIDKGDKTPEGGKPAEKAAKSQEPSKLSAEVQEKLDRLEYLERVTTDPVFSLAEKLIKEGKSVKDLVKSLDVSDYDAMSPREIMEIELKSQGFKEDELAEALSDFDAEPSYKQKITTNPIRSKLKQAADEKNNSFSSQPTKEEIKEFAKVQKQAATAGMNRLNELIEKTVTEGYFGFPLKAEDLAVVRDEVMNNTMIAPDGKSYDVDATFTRAINHPSIIKKAIKYAREVGRFEGYDDFIKERVRVDKNDFVTGSQGGKSEYQFAAGTVTPSV